MTHVDPDQWTPHFHRKEFSVSASHPELAVPIPEKFVPKLKFITAIVLEPLRSALGTPITILSGYRSYSLNRAVGGSKTSQHRVGEAVDFTCPEIYGAVERLILLANEGFLMGIGQMIYYPKKKFIHVAITSPRFPDPTMCIHDLGMGLEYRAIPRNLASLHSLVPYRG